MVSHLHEDGDRWEENTCLHIEKEVRSDQQIYFIVSDC